jgi:hypothetical protein
LRTQILRQKLNDVVRRQSCRVLPPDTRVCVRSEVDANSSTDCKAMEVRAVVEISNDEG